MCNGIKLVFGVIIMLVSLQPVRATEYCVDYRQTTNAPDGLDWDTAYPDLRVALEELNLQPFDLVKVAIGSYRPAGVDGDQTMSFVLVNGVTIQGGYNGLSDAFNPNGWALDPALTILSGDLNGDDDDGDPFDQAARENNSYNVIKAGDGSSPVSQLTIITNVTIRDGHGSGSGDTGAGLFVPETDPASNPTISHCIFTRNYAANSGGAVFQSDAESVTGSTMSFDHCQFIDNETTGAGGAIAGDLSTRISINECTFSNNRVADGGGGGGAYYGHATSVLIRQSLFADNLHLTDQSGMGGGAIRVDEGVDIEIRNSAFDSNFSASSGGAILLGSSTVSVNIVNSFFEGNWVEGGASQGGAIYTKTKVDSLKCLTPYSRTTLLWATAQREARFSLMTRALEL